MLDMKLENYQHNQQRNVLVPCKNNDMCSFFTWTKKKKKCIMKSAIGKRKRKKGAYSGSVDCCRTQGNYLSMKKI